MEFCLKSNLEKNVVKPKSKITAKMVKSNLLVMPSLTLGFLRFTTHAKSRNLKLNFKK